ncbi:MAG: IscS subfamily cysteine desulfurase [Eubacteriales bacterium]
MREVYLDYSATTPVKKEVLDEMMPYFSEKFGNPSSLYRLGFDSKDAIQMARKKVADLISANDREIFFTSSGTEADNWAIISGVKSREKIGKHVITTQIEHHAVLHSCEYLEKNGYEITYLGVNQDGQINLTELENAITDKTALISIMFANNEIGSIQQIKKISEIARKYKVLFHTDAVQALGNIPIDVKDLGVDMMSLSAHKIYGPKGIGALYIRKGILLPNYIHGGAQENNKRAGTENLTGIVGFGKAAELSGMNLDFHIESIRKHRDYFISNLFDKIPDIDINGGMENRLPGNANIVFNGVEGEALLLYMDVKGISASTGSACSSATFAASHVLKALAHPLERVYCSIRFTIGDFTTKDDLDYAIDEIVMIVGKLRAFSPLYEKKGKK